jgi:hypothetical protein
MWQEHVRGLPILGDPFLHISGSPESSEFLGVLPESSDYTLTLLDMFHPASQHPTVQSLLMPFLYMCFLALLARFP